MTEQAINTAKFCITWWLVYACLTAPDNMWAIVPAGGLYLWGYTRGMVDNTRKRTRSTLWKGMGYGR